MALEQFLRILWARRWAALAAFVACVAAGVGGTMLWPKKYSASAQVLLDMKATDPVSGLPGAAGASPGYLATELDVVRSTRVALRVVDGLRLAQNAQLRADHLRSGSETPLREWIAEQLVAQLKVRPSRDSTVLEITYAGSEAKFVAIVANAFARAYIDTSLELRVEPARQQSAWFDERAKALRANLDAAQRRLSEYQRKYRIVSIDERLDVENGRLQELSTQLVALQALSAESAKRAALARTAAAGGIADLATVPDVLQSGIVASLKTELVRLESRQADVAANLGRNHPDHLKLSEEIGAMRPRLEREMQAVASSLGRTAQLNTQREAEVQASLERQRSKVLELKARRDEFTVLTRDVEAAQRAFDEVFQRSSKVGLESLLRQTNAQLLDAAVPPSNPTSPILLVNAIVSTVLGVLAAVALVLLLELPDRRVRSAADASSATGLPVLGTVGRDGRSWIRRWTRRAEVPRLAAY
jgi:succinoglycan biosynthesis transport protein ExoP